MKAWMNITLAVALGVGTVGAQGRGGQEEDLIALVRSLPAEVLSPGESASLVLMREEEKLARDIYTFLAKKWNVPVFSNIAASEQTHMDAIGFLLTRYHLSDPALAQAGEFRDPTLKKLYSDLTAQGSKSLVEAFRVSAEVEDLDIADLESALNRVDNRDVGVLYQNLAKASRNHIRSFVAQLERAGGSYTARHVNADYLAYTLGLNRETAPITDPHYEFRR